MVGKSKKAGFCYPGYRYCGPGCSGPGKPTNAVDACCKLHDECYSKYGRTKQCDEIFQKCLLPEMNSRSRMGRNAKLFANVFKIKNTFL